MNAGSSFTLLPSSRPGGQARPRGGRVTGAISSRMGFVSERNRETAPMRLTLQTDYALRMLMYLAINRGRSCRVTDVATDYGISRNHLLKVALKLGRLGYVNTLRGRTGGVALAAPPEKIRLGDVVRQMEDDFALTECMRGDGGLCAISPACRLKGVVGEAMEAFLGVFDSFTLADIVRNRPELAELLGASGQGENRTWAKPRREG